MADTTDVQTMNRVLVLLSTAQDMITEARTIARKNLGDHRVTHEADVAWNSIDNTCRMVKMQIEVAREG